MSSLILTLPLARSGPATEYPYTLSPDGHNATRHARASAALLPAMGRAASEVVAVVPVRALSWQRVTLPPGISLQSPRLRVVLDPANLFETDPDHADIIARAVGLAGSTRAFGRLGGPALAAVPRLTGDLAADPYYRWLNTWHFMPVVVTSTAILYFGGLSMFLWAVCVKWPWAANT